MTTASLSALAWKAAGLPGYIRLDHAPQELAEQLGPLADLVGTWEGACGWNLISVPRGASGFQALLNPIVETLAFTAIGALVPNRGGAAGLMQVPGLHYTLTVSDAEQGTPLHLENGMWLLLNPPDGRGPSQVARLFSVPHGNVGLALGGFSTQDGPPTLPDNSAMPDSGPATPPGYTESLSLLPGPFRADNPNAVLQAQLTGQKVLRTTTFNQDTTPPGGGLLNIPFITQHADCRRLRASFWLETVDDGQGGTFLQLQYSQQVDLFFLPRFGDAGLIQWPHVTVNCLRRR
ncbi:heme-binding protein [Ideonella livida]|uniref:DUF1794 domain-containing protein n=1 Tax=Ideonella livida TaxID=2707176 RepID=A0A7C9TMA9_9BURK|nr:heme-binding protein [Ideonella livida]NDY93818.1 hypothetical protein [Ideonella livida]